jgi:hypothetical protein
LASCVTESVFSVIKTVSLASKRPLQ